MFYEWRPYVPVAERRRNAQREMATRAKQGHVACPVVLSGRTIATTFWGTAWCENLERYSDYANRLPRGRTYVRNGSVVDLQVSSGEVNAFVAGSSLYKVAIKVSPLPQARWNQLCKDCSGAIDSLVELLQGRFSKGVMERICQPNIGLFPAPADIQLKCSCPDWATMCKHVAAVLYGVGARLDEHPELLFRLRCVDEKELIATAGKGLPLANRGPASSKVLAGDGLSGLFGLEMAPDASASTKTPKRSAPPRAPRAPRAIDKPETSVASLKPAARAAARKPAALELPRKPARPAALELARKPAKPAALELARKPAKPAALELPHKTAGARATRGAGKTPVAAPKSRKAKPTATNRTGGAARSFAVTERPVPARAKGPSLAIDSKPKRTMTPSSTNLKGMRATLAMKGAAVPSPAARARATMVPTASGRATATRNKRTA